jgi:hypothetical protein
MNKKPSKPATQPAPDCQFRPRKPRPASIYFKIRLTPAQRLLAAVIREAVKEYHGYETLGLIVNGRMRVPARCRCLFVVLDECQSLIGFFRPGGDMDHLIGVGRLGVRGDVIRERLGMPASQWLD